MPRAFENPKTNSAGFRADLSACEVTESSFEVLTDARPIGPTLAIYEVQQTQAKTGFALLSGLATRWIRYLLSALHDRRYHLVLWYPILGLIGDKLDANVPYCALTFRKGFCNSFLFRLLAQAFSVLFCFGHSPPPNKPKKFRRRPKGISTRSRKGLNRTCRIKFLPCRWISKHGRVRQARLKWRWRTRRIRSDRLKWWLAGKCRANRGCSNSKTKSTPVKGLTLRDCVVARVKSVAACLLKMWTWFSTLDHDPYLGVRVGEATHPGPAGSRVTKRRRAAKQVAGVPGELVQQVVQAVFQALAQQGFRFPEQPKPAKKKTVKTEKEKKLNMPAPPPVPERVSFYPPTKGPGAFKSIVGGASGADPPRMPKPQAQKTQTKSWVTVAATPSDQGRGRLLPSVWPLKAVQPVATVRKQLEEGVWPEGQVTWCHSKEEIDQLQALCKLHELPNQPFALGLRVDGVSSFTGGTECQLPVAWGDRVSFENFRFWALNSSLPKLPQHVVSKSNVIPAKPDLTSVFVFIPQAFMTKDSWMSVKAQPHPFMTEWFQSRPKELASALQASHAWREERLGNEVFLKGTLRILASQGENILTWSGKDGIFFSPVQSASIQQTPVKWIPKFKDEDPQVYFQRVSRQADKTPMAWRKGGGASLGIRVSHDAKDEGLTNCWKVRGVPREWTDTDLASALIGAGWTEISIKTIPQFRKQPWFIRARGPGKLGEEVAAVQVGNDLLTLEKAQAHTRKAPTLAFLKPKARPSQTTFGERRGTSAQVRDSDTPMNNTETPENSEKSRERSPRRAANASASVATDVVPQWPDPDSFEELDCGGLGQCGFNAIAAGFAINEGMIWTEAKKKMVTRGKTLRQQAHQYITEHEDDFKHAWCVDPSWTQETEGGSVATHWKEWLEHVLRPKRWICQYTVRALASRLGAKIVIVQGGGGQAWERPIAVGAPEHLTEPIVVSLREHHYRLIRAAPGYELPDAWTKAVSCCNPGPEVRGGGSSCASDAWLPPRSAGPRSRSSSVRSVPQSSAAWSDDWLPPRSDVRRRARSSSVKSAPPSKRSRSSPFSKVAASSDRRSSDWLPPRSSSHTSVHPGVPLSVRSLPSPSSRGSATSNAYEDDKRLRSFQWVCNVCHCVIHASSSTQLCNRRSRHIQQHKGHDASQFTNCRAALPITPVSHQRPRDEVDWQCAFCDGTLPNLPRRVKRASALAHLAQCEFRPKGKAKLNMNDNLAARVKRLGGTPFSVKALKTEGQSNLGRAAELARAVEQLEQLAQIAESTEHRIVRVEIPEGRKHHGVLFTCSQCAKTWRKMGNLQHDVQTNAVGFCEDREKRLRSSSNRQFWWKAGKELRAKFAKVWKLSAKEKKSFTLKGEDLRKKMGRPGGLHAGDAKRRRQAAGLNLKGRIRAKGLLHFQREKMVREGVEPNPGPSSCSWHGVTLNCGSGAASWAVVDEICDGKLRPDVLCLQETCFTPSSLAAASRKLAFKGFRLWATPPDNSVSGQFKRGVAMVVKLSLNATHVSNFSDPSGQVVVGQVGQTLIVSIWRSEREGVDQTPILYHLGEILTQAASFRQNVVLTGDWNWTPEENLFVRSGEFQLLAMNDADGYVPTRWKGERAIDYTLLSHGLDGSAVALLPQVFGDHKAFHFKISTPASHGDTLVTARTARLHKPVGCSLEDWHAAVTEAWDLSEALVASLASDESQDVDAQWHVFCATLEQALRLASCKFGQPIQQGLRQKGSAPVVLQADDVRLCGSSYGSFRQRSIRKLLGRVRECNRQFSKTGRRDPNLVAAITRTWPSDLSWSGWFPAEEMLELELQTMVKESVKFRIDEWKAKMCQRGRYATNWLKGLVNPGVPEILSAHDQVAPSVKDGFHVLADFWKKIWHREEVMPRLSELQALCDSQTWREPFPEGDMWFPSAAQLMVRAQETKGTAPGCDGWSGQEVGSLPIVVFDKFLTLVKRWSILGQWPSSWQHIRQVHTRKEQGVGPVRPKDLRPIAVLSVWYRILLTAVSRQEAVQQWILRIAPAACHGGLRGRSVATALSQLLPALEQGSTALALDYRKCFDMTHPKLVLGHMKLHRWPPGLMSLFEHVWLQQHRWLELGHLVDATPHIVSSSLPQGDPFSPLGLLLVLGDATQEVAALGVSQSVFMDDRVLVAPTVRQLLRAQQLWARWSERLGLQENPRQGGGFSSKLQATMGS